MSGMAVEGGLKLSKGISCLRPDHMLNMGERDR